MNRLFLLCFLLIINTLAIVAQAQEKFTVNGYVKDAANGEGMIGVSVYSKESGTGAVTNNYGFYAVTLPRGTYTFVISYVGYEKETRTVALTDQNLRLDLELKEEGRDLKELVVSTRREDDNVTNIEMSVNRVDIKTIQRIPALLGEVDVVRSIQLLPGVSTVGEGATGFNVRGGGIDQNLVLLDEAPVYNSSHLFGFFSVFNPDAVKDVKLIKGGIPAMYGGRIASILDVRLKEGNSKKGELNGGIGLIFSRLSYERPLFKGKGSFIVAGRRSYADVLAQPFLKGDLKGSQFYFYDLTAKANVRLNEKNTIFLSGYFGRDVFGADFGFNWGNATTSLRWNKVFNDKLFLNTTAFYSNYDYSLDSDLRRKPENNSDYFRTNAKIVNYSIKPDFTLYWNKNTVTFGGQALLYDFQPGIATAASAGTVRTFGLASKYALESSLYVGNEQQATSRLQLQYGLRYSFYQYLGPGEVFTFGPSPAPGLRSRPVTETRTYKAGETIEIYGNLEPRFALKYDLTAGSSLKLSYNRLAQYVHLLSNTTASTPLDVWTPSTNNVAPQLADQVAAGYFRNFGGADGNLFEASVEVYYKSLQNQIDYIDRANLVLNRFLEGDLLPGKGRAYGAEFYLRKSKGQINGWISYTLAKTERLVDGVNENNWYPTRFDKRHTLNVVALYDPIRSKRWNFSATFAFATGTPATFFSNRYNFQNIAVGNNPNDVRNNYRIQPYHRLDLAATLQGRKKPGKRKEDNWVFSVYNAYGRKNPFSEYYQANPENVLQTQAIRYSVFATVIPSVTYNFKF